MDWFSLLFGFWVVYFAWWINTALLIIVIILLWKIRKELKEPNVCLEGL